MATLYLKTAGGNWTAAGTWSATSAAGGDSAGPPTASDDCIAELLSGNVTISATSVGKSFSSTAGTGTWAGTFTHNAFNLTISGNITFNSGMTYTPLATSTITLNANSTITSGGLLFPLMAITSGTTTLADNLSFMASKVLTLTITGTLNLNGMTLSGNSATNRILVRSVTMGTPVTITVASGTFANADFRDIALDVSTNLSAITGNSGDCGGNSNITFTSSATQYYYRNTGSWSDATLWFLASGGTGGAGRVPLPQDDVVFDASSISAGSQTVTQDMPRIGRTIDFSASTTNFSWSTNTLNFTLYGSLVFDAQVAINDNNKNIIFEGRGAFTYTGAGKTLGLGGDITFQIAMFGGSLMLNDSLTMTSGAGGAKNISLVNGTFDANDFNVTADNFSSTGTNTRAINMGAGTWTVQSTATSTPWNVTASLSVTPSTSTIIIGKSASNVRTFAGAGLTYANISIATGGTGSVNFTGSNTFNVFTIAAPKTVKFTAGTTTTVSDFIATGDASNIITISSITAATHTLSKSSGTVSATGVNLTNSIATGGATWYAGATPPSVDNGGNSGWIFTAPATVVAGFGQGRFGLNRFGQKRFGLTRFGAS